MTFRKKIVLDEYGQNSLCRKIYDKHRKGTIMKISPPLCITSRLCAGFTLDDGSSVSIEYSDLPGNNGRQRYHYFIDTADGFTAEGEDLESGVGNGNLQSGLENLIVFIITAGEDRDPEDRIFGEFPWMHEWSKSHGDELSCFSCEIEEQRLIEE